MNEPNEALFVHSGQKGKKELALVSKKLDIGIFRYIKIAYEKSDDRGKRRSVFILFSKIYRRLV